MQSASKRDARSANRDISDARDQPLFIGEDELRRRLCPRMGKARFKSALRALDAHGFPKIDALWGGWYWPSVKAWLDLYYAGFPSGQQFIMDGPETFHAPKKP